MPRHLLPYDRQVRCAVCAVSPCSSVHTWLNETKAGETLSSLLLLRWKGDRFLTCPTHLTATVISAFPVHAHPSLMSLCGRWRNDLERLASATFLMGPEDHYQDLLGRGPHLDYEWGLQWKARYAPSGSNTRWGSAAHVATCVVVSPPSLWLRPCVTGSNTDHGSNGSRGTQQWFVAMFGTHEVIVTVLWGKSVLFMSTHVHRFLLSPETQTQCLSKDASLIWHLTL